MIVEAGAAAVIAVTTHGPFGEVERATGRWLPAMRLLAAVGLCGLAILALQLGVVGESLNDGILVLARTSSASQDSDWRARWSPAACSPGYCRLDTWRSASTRWLKPGVPRGPGRP